MSTAALRINPLLAAPNVVNEAEHWTKAQETTLATTVAACQRGDQVAQRRLYEASHQNVYRLMVRMVGLQDASDLTQQVTLAGLLVATSTNADFRDYNYKAWAQTGKQRSPQSASRSRSMYRSTALRTEPAPNAVAQAPTEQRSFSYEPSQQSVSSGCGCPVEHSGN